jgi:hypothetical protein
MKNPITMNFMLFISFLVIGYSVSTMFYHPEYSDSYNSSRMMFSTSQSSIRSLENGQRNFLLIGVNTLDPFEAKLESLWLVTNLPPDPTFQFLPILNVGNETDSDFENQLYRIFKIEKKNDNLVPTSDFMEVLKENNYWWSGYIVIDQVAIEDIINRLEKVNGDAEFFSANQSINEDLAIMGNLQNSFSIDLALRQTACQFLSGFSQNPELLNNLLLDSDHVATDLDRNQLLLEWNALSSNDQRLNCRFPTLEFTFLGN